MSDAQRQCDEWNATYGIGSRVRVQRDDGQIMQTRTRSSAYVMASGDAVIFLDHVRGWYLLARVHPHSEAAAVPAPGATTISKKHPDCVALMCGKTDCGKVGPCYVRVP